MKRVVMITLVLGVALFLAGLAAAVSPPDPCSTSFPTPTIALKGVSGNTVYIGVTNWQEYSNDRFVAPLGVSMNNRTSPSIYEAVTDKYIYGFADFTSNQDLKQFWFGASGASGKVYVVIYDRYCETRVKSNTINWSK